MEIMQLVNTSANELNAIETLIKWALAELNISDRGLIIYITDDHNKVREVLGLVIVHHEEWPIKYIRLDDINIISVIPNKLLSLNYDEARIVVLREAALVKIMDDPTLISIWNPPPSINDELVYRVSLALLKRTIDFVIASSQTLTQYLINAYNIDEMRNLILACQSTIDCAVTALALDVPLSIEIAGNKGLGRSLWDNTIKGLSNEFYRRYDDFRDFVRNNFNIESTYNYLMMIFKRGY
nr:MAG: hypothetical protein TU36_03195 [Vulcanisaeta sp. AZ3]